MPTLQVRQAADGVLTVVLGVWQVGGVAGLHHGHQRVRGRPVSQHGRVAQSAAHGDGPRGDVSDRLHHADAPHILTVSEGLQRVSRLN